MKSLSEKSVGMIRINKWRFVSLVAYWLFFQVGCDGEGEGEAVVSIPGLILEHDVEPDNIIEGSSINFQCILHTNTSALNSPDNDHGYEILWLHNDEVLDEMGPGTGMYLSKNKLELSIENVGTWSSGQYVCLIKTHSGEVISNTIEVSVKYKPQCKTHENTLFGASRDEQVEIECRVDANPPPLEKHFKWAFLSSLDSYESESSETAAMEDRFPNSVTNVLAYTPKTELDYGSILCWSTNEIGEQLHPCVYRVISAAKPDAPYNCSTREMSENSWEGEEVEIEIECTEGFDGGLAQIFHLEVAEARGGKLLYNLTSRVPFFLLRKPWTKEGFWMTIYSSNSKGRSSYSLPLNHYLVHDETTVTFELLSHPHEGDQDMIREGDNVVFKCTINPPRDAGKYKLEFLHDWGKMKEDLSLGVRVADNSLFLSNLTKWSSGKYHCLLTLDDNGREKLSAAVDLRVKFRPTCKDITTQKLEYAALPGETVEIDCQVDSYPDIQPTSNYEWILERKKQEQILSKDQLSSEGATLSYTVFDDTTDYGSVLCWATNEIGRQEEPCVYHVIPAEKPAWAWDNCTVNNITWDSFDIDCLDGLLYDHIIALPFGNVIIKGLPEVYHAQVFDAHSSELLLNLSSLMPFFQVSPHNIGGNHLFQPGQSLRIVVFSSNRVGDSNHIVIDTILTRSHPATEQHETKGGADLELMTLTSILGIGTGVACALCLLTLTVLASILFAHKYRNIYNKADAAKNHPLVHL